MRALDARTSRRTRGAAARIRQDLAYTNARLRELERELDEVKDGTHHSVIAVMRQGQSREDAVRRTMTVITTIRTHLLARQAQFLEALSAIEPAG